MDSCVDDVTALHSGHASELEVRRSAKRTFTEFRKSIGRGPGQSHLECLSACKGQSKVLTLHLHGHRWQIRHFWLRNSLPHVDGHRQGKADHSRKAPQIAPLGSRKFKCDCPGRGLPRLVEPTQRYSPGVIAQNCGCLASFGSEDLLRQSHLRQWQRSLEDKLAAEQ